MPFHTVFCHFCVHLQMRPMEDVVKMVEHWYPAALCNAIYAETHPPEAPFLPQVYTFQSGFKVLIRQAQKEDDRILYDLITRAARTGRGYGASEFPTLETFRIWMLADELCVVLVDLATQTIIGFTAFGDSGYVRNSQSKVSESSVVLSDAYQGRGLGKELVWVELALQKELGYVASINDCLASNGRVRSVIGRVMAGKYAVLGQISKGSYTEGVGWDDQIVQMYDFETFEFDSFTELIKKNHSKYPNTQQSKL